MKKSNWFLIVALLLSSLLFAQTEIEEEKMEMRQEMNEAREEVAEAMDEVREALQEINIVVDIPEINRTASDAYMGIYTKDLTLAKAAELEYTEFYGVLITGVVEDTPAYYFRLVSNDIIMQMDDVQIKSKTHFNRVLAPYRVGDQIELHIFRNGKSIVVPFVFGSSNTKFTFTEGQVVLEQKQEKEISKSKKSRRNTGNGGIGWTPTYYMADVEDLNATFQNLGFGEEMLDEDGFLLDGIAFQGEAGHNWFVGFQHNSFEDSKTTRVDWINVMPETAENIKRKVTYDYEHWGFSLDKRFAISKHLVSSMGFMLGFAEQEIKVKQSFEVTGEEELDFSGDMGEFVSDNYVYKSKLYLEKDYLVAEPRIMVMWHPLDWFGIRVQAGYLASYSSKGWKAKINGDKADYNNAPDDDLNGLTVSVGPWFGF